jgi:amyloid beta (A4) precursor protein-binding family A protein 1 (X11)
MMDHSLRTISYIADIGDICVIMARRRMITSPGDDMMRRKKQSKIICHVFESEEVGPFDITYHLVHH